MPQTRCYYKRHLRRTPTWGVPRFRHRFDETLDRGLILPRGLRTVTVPAEQAGSRLEITDDPRPGTTQDFTFTATLNAGQQEAASEPARHDRPCLRRKLAAIPPLTRSRRFRTIGGFSPRPRRESRARSRLAV